MTATARDAAPTFALVIGDDRRAPRVRVSSPPRLAACASHALAHHESSSRGMRRIWARLLLRSHAALAWCSPSAAHAQALSDRRTAAIESGVDESISPGDDFFAYANGSWLRSTAIPAGKDRWNARDEIEELTRHRVAELLDDARAAPSGSARAQGGRLSRGLHGRERQSRRRDSLRFEPLLDSIDRIHDKARSPDCSARGVRADVDPLELRRLQIVACVGIVGGGEHPRREELTSHSSSRAGSGLPDREDYVSAIQASVRCEPRTRSTSSGSSHSPDSIVQTSARGGDGARDRDRRSRRPLGKHRRTITTPISSGPAPTSHAKRPEWTGTHSSRGEAVQPEGIRGVAAVRPAGLGGAGRVATDRDMEGLSSLSRHRAICGRSAARVRRTGAARCMRPRRTTTRISPRARNVRSRRRSSPWATRSGRCMPIAISRLRRRRVCRPS